LRTTFCNPLARIGALFLTIYIKDFLDVILDVLVVQR